MSTNNVPTTTFGKMDPVPLLQRRAYVTFLAAGEGHYVKGVVGLAEGLKKSKTIYPLVVAVLPDVPKEHRDVLVSLGCIVREIEPVHPPENQTQFAEGHGVVNYSKLQIWQEYWKMIYLDGDTIVFGNIDDLFTLPNEYLYAVMDCFCEDTWSQSPQYEIGYCQQSPEEVQWPSEWKSPPPDPYFNAGMFVFEPKSSNHRKLLSTLQVTPPTPLAEQDFLNKFFKKVYKPISYEYNLVMPMLWRHPEKVNLDDAKVVHCCVEWAKEWRYAGKEENWTKKEIGILVQSWWDVNG